MNDSPRALVKGSKGEAWNKDEVVGTSSKRQRIIGRGTAPFLR
ncbi:MAG: hypothetical protein ACTSUC_00820 [Promethearchaeota archaeon]